MSANTPKRSASHAKTLNLDQEQVAFDRALKLKKEFERARAPRENSLEQKHMPQAVIDRALTLKAEFERAKAASQNSLEQKHLRQEAKYDPTAHAPTAQAHLRPAGEIGRVVDKQIDDERQRREDERSKALSAQYKERARQQNLRDLELQNEREDRGR